MKKLLFLIAMAIGIGVFLFLFNVFQSSQNKANSLWEASLPHESNNGSNVLSSLSPSIFSIEQSEADSEIRIIAGGKLFMQNNDFSFPSFLSDIFKKQDAVFIALENQVFTPEILTEKNSYKEDIASKRQIEEISQSHISHFLLVSNSLFSRGKFFADLTIGNIFSTVVTPVYEGNNQIITKGNTQSIIIAHNTSKSSNTEIVETLITAQKKNDSEKNSTVIIFLDFANPTIQIHSQQMQTLARLCIDNGADIVMGIGAEKILPIERYKEGIIMYSLGTVHDFQHKNSNGIFAEIVLSPEKNTLYIHPFHFTDSTEKQTFSFYSDVEKFEFFSQAFFLNFSSIEIQNISQGINLSLDP